MTATFRTLLLAAAHLNRTDFLTAVLANRPNRALDDTEAVTYDVIAAVLASRQPTPATCRHCGHGIYQLPDYPDVYAHIDSGNSACPDRMVRGQQWERGTHADIDLYALHSDR